MSLIYPPIYLKEVSQKMVDRINNLSPKTQPQWGTMNAAQMLAHCDVAYQMVYEPQKFKKPGAVARFMITLFAKKMVVGDKPYPKNGRTAPGFIVPAEQDFEESKRILIEHIWRVQQDGEKTFDGKESHSMGNLASAEWNMLFSKHLDHHLKQFGV